MNIEDILRRYEEENPDEGDGDGKEDSSQFGLNGDLFSEEDRCEDCGHIHPEKLPGESTVDATVRVIKQVAWDKFNYSLDEAPSDLITWILDSGFENGRDSMAQRAKELSSRSIERIEANNYGNLKGLFTGTLRKLKEQKASLKEIAEKLSEAIGKIIIMHEATNLGIFLGEDPKVARREVLKAMFPVDDELLDIVQDQVNSMGPVFDPSKIDTEIVQKMMDEISKREGLKSEEDDTPTE